MSGNEDAVGHDVAHWRRIAREQAAEIARLKAEVARLRELSKSAPAPVQFVGMVREARHE
jgi:hypothetical protein